MPHWSQRYVGRPYAAGVYDCAALVEAVQREEFNRALSLPAERPAGWRSLSALIELQKANFAAPTTSPVDGDGVLMVGRGYLNHLGVYCVIGGRPWVLHNMKRAGAVVLHRARELERYGLRIEGYYRWK